VAIGFLFYAALIHITAGLDRPRAPLHLLFAALTLAVTVLAASLIMIYQSRSVPEAAFTLKWNFAALSVIYALLAWFVADYTGFRPLPFLLGFSAANMLQFLINLEALWGHPLKGSCQEKRLTRLQKRAIFFL
jgi:hypothetical protein